VFRAYWTDDRDISQDEVLADLCGRVGVEPGRFLAGIATPEVKAQLKANTDEAIARGSFGSPTIFVGNDMYFGNDRLPLVREAVLRRKQGTPAPSSPLEKSQC
jgi:2-hydroxychromene-2-carboxylate isomerase